jgi:hypothetical protein
MLVVPLQDCVELKSYPNFFLCMACVESMALMLHGKNQGFRNEVCSIWLPLDTQWCSCLSTQMKPLIISKHVGGIWWWKLLITYNPMLFGQDTFGVQTTYNEPMCLLYIADYCIFWGPFSQETRFLRKEFSNEMFWNILYIVFTVAPRCHFLL